MAYINFPCVCLGQTESAAAQRDGLKLDGGRLQKTRSGESVQHGLGQQQRGEGDTLRQNHIIGAFSRFNVVSGFPHGGSHVHTLPAVGGARCFKEQLCRFRPLVAGGSIKLMLLRL